MERKWDEAKKKNSFGRYNSSGTDGEGISVSMAAIVTPLLESSEKCLGEILMTTGNLSSTHCVHSSVCKLTGDADIGWMKASENVLASLYVFVCVWTEDPFCGCCPDQSERRC